MSLNGELWIIRNGRCTSEISVFNYPEHLNPFYEEDNHKRLRFWKINTNNEGRRNSFSLDGLRNIWGFKSLRLKKKSSTLGINKTSESPPELRRNIKNISATSKDFLNINSRQLRYSSPQEVDKFNSNFKRNEIARNTLSHVDKSKNVTKNEIGFDRNNKYRSTVQIGEKPFLYSRDNNKYNTTARITRGSSESSIVSTNPFDSEEDNKIITNKIKRKKKKAPAPPVVNITDVKLIKSIKSAPSTTTSEKNSSNLTGFEELNNDTIANLTAEIVEFVEHSKINNHSNNELSQATYENTVNSDIIKKNQNKQNSTELCFDSQRTVVNIAKDDHGNNNHSKSNSDEFETPVETQVETENGQFQCIYVNNNTVHPIPRKTMLTFQQDTTKDLRINGKTKFTLNKRQETSSTNHTEECNSAANEKHLSEQNEKLMVTHPFIDETQEKQVNINKYSKKTVEEIKTKTGPETDSIIISNIENISPSSSVQNGHLNRESLKIVESTENIIETCNTPSFTSPQPLQTENFFHETKIRSLGNWKKSSLAPLQSNIPAEKRRTVQEIIESINKSQSLLCGSKTSSYSQSKLQQLETSEMTKGKDHNEHKIIDSQKIINNEIVNKDHFPKNDCPYRESSPTISNLDWNPLPKPKRSKNMSEF